MNRDITDFLEDILAYSQRAEEIVRDSKMSTLTEFSIESMAVVRCMEVIGEAIKKIPESMRTKYPEIKWREAAGLRDILIHRYWAANMAVLVRVVERDLPGLRNVVQQILEDLNTEK